MSNNLVEINANDLTGPRSSFTDIDPKDTDYQEDFVRIKLKLQLLTKEKIIIAASSLFHDIGDHLFAGDKGLIAALENGIIIPAIRNEYAGPEEFFNKRKSEYSLKAKKTMKKLQTQITFDFV